MSIFQIAKTLDHCMRICRCHCVLHFYGDARTCHVNLPGSERLGNMDIFFLLLAKTDILEASRFYMVLCINNADWRAQDTLQGEPVSLCRPWACREINKWELTILVIVHTSSWTEYILVCSHQSLWILHKTQVALSPPTKDTANSVTPDG